MRPVCARRGTIAEAVRTEPEAWLEAPEPIALVIEADRASGGRSVRNPPLTRAEGNRPAGREVCRHMTKAAVKPTKRAKSAKGR